MNTKRTSPTKSMSGKPRREPRRRTPRPTTPQAERSAAKEPAPLLEYPQRGEVINSPQYSLRIRPPEEASAVEVSIGDAGWRPARFAAGFWWYDWSGYASGDYELAIRAFDQKGLAFVSEQHRVTVSL